MRYVVRVILVLSLWSNTFRSSDQVVAQETQSL